MTEISTKGMTRAEWLTLRRTGAGGSDAAAILGLNEYSSPYSVWADKLGLLPEREDTEAMRQGRDLEDYVARRFCEQTGKKVRRKNASLADERRPHMMANIDREVLGESAGLECKTTSVMNLKKFKNGEYPAAYYCQCMHYLAVTGWDRWYLAVLVLNQGFYVYEIERDEEEIQSLIRQEADFWALVESRTPPPVDGSEATKRAIEAMNPTDEDMPPALLYGMEGHVATLAMHKQHKKDVEQAIDKINNELRAALAGSAVGLMHGYEVRLQTIIKQPYTVTPKPYTQIRIKETASL